MFASNFSAQLPSARAASGAADTSAGLHVLLGQLRTEHPVALRLHCRLHSSGDDAADTAVAASAASVIKVLKFSMYSRDARGPFTAAAPQARRAFDVTLLVEGRTQGQKEGDDHQSLQAVEAATGMVMHPASQSIFNVATRKLLQEHQYHSVPESAGLVASAIEKLWRMPGNALVLPNERLTAAATK